MKRISSWACHCGIGMSAMPERYGGKRPTEIRFTGSISALKPGKIEYRFVRSYGASAPVETLAFTIG